MAVPPVWYSTKRKGRWLGSVTGICGSMDIWCLQLNAQQRCCWMEWGQGANYINESWTTVWGGTDLAKPRFGLELQIRQILDLDIQIIGLGWQNSGCGHPNPGFGRPNLGFGRPNPGFEHPNPDLDVNIQDSAIQIQDLDTQILLGIRGSNWGVIWISCWDRQLLRQPNSQQWSMVQLGRNSCIGGQWAVMVGCLGLAAFVGHGVHREASKVCFVGQVGFKKTLKMYANLLKSIGINWIHRN